MFWRKLLLVFNVILQASSGEDHSTSEMGDFVGDSSKEMEEDLRRYQGVDGTCSLVLQQPLSLWLCA